MAQLSYSKFLWNSANLHGVHSPFVFGITRALTTKTMLYPKATTETLDKKTIDVLFRIIVNLHKEKLVVLGEDAGTVTDLLRNYGQELNLKLWFFSTFAPISGNLDLIYISATDAAPILPQIETLIASIGSNTVCAIGNIHSSAQAEHDWETIKKDPRVTVSIDTYHLGLIFFRPEQAKEDFMIRTTTSKVLDFTLGIKNLWGLLY